MRHIKKHIGVHHINTFEKLLLVAVIVAAGIFGLFHGLSAYPKVFKTEITLEKTINIRPEEPIIIDFSIPPLTKEYNSGIVITPSENYELRWGRSNVRLSILPENFWKPNTQYEIILPPGKNVMFSKIISQTVAFSTEKYPLVSGVSPKNTSENAAIDIEDPIVVNFEKSTSDFFIKFVLNSDEDLSVQNNVSKTQFKLLPKKGIEYATKYDLKVYAKYAKDTQDNYEQIYKSAFTTAPLPQIVWDDNYSVRLEQAKKYTRAKIATGKYIDINLSAQIMAIFENGKMLENLMISTGKKGMGTPKGRTEIYNKFPRAYSREYGLYMPYWMAIAPSGKYGLHELPEWPGGYKEGASHLGIPVSHGCVRMGVGAAKRVYEWAEIGTPVVVY